jgi:hypothetical protein
LDPTKRQAAVVAETVLWRFSSKTKLLHFLEGGGSWCTGEQINGLVKKMI